MVRSLWSAATGMLAQQINVDTIANNLANVNTTGYKTEVAEFKSLLYQTMQTKTTSANGDLKPIGAQIGLGVRNSAITSIYKQGNMIASENATAFAITGNGFFGVRGADGNTYYTRNGNFTLSRGTTGLALCTTDGLQVLDNTGKPIVFANNIIANKLVVTSEGDFYYPDANGKAQKIGTGIGIFQFMNPAGLEKGDSSLYTPTAASGEVLNERTNQNLKKSALQQGYLEGSNVQVADEMVNLIVAQRAYEMNSKAIQASDEMMGQANQLRR